jgi:tRNA (guanine-N7-)-methyltransferase
MIAAKTQEISNLKLYLADATDVLDECIEDDSIDRIQLYFPDPWHKKKHNKRRIVQPNFVRQVRAKLSCEGIFHMATDWQPYAEQMLEIMSEADGFENCAGTDQYSPRPDYRPLTKFEMRGERLGHGVWDLLFRKLG